MINKIINSLITMKAKPSLMKKIKKLQNRKKQIKKKAKLQNHKGRKIQINRNSRF